MTQGGASRAGQWLLHLQRSHGNRYVERVVALAQGENGEGEVTPAVESGIERSRGGGQGLDSGVRSQMELALSADFGGVRVHTDQHSDTLNQAVGAVAFTTGQDIFFSQNAYNPHSTDGRHLLAHELAHVVQQGGPAIQPKLTISGPDDAFEKEASQVANAISRASSAGAPDQELSRCACGGTCEACSKSQSAMDGFETANGSMAIQRQPAGTDVVQQEVPQTGGSPVAAPAPVPAGGCPPTDKIPRPDARFIGDNLCLLSQGLTGDDRLNDAFHNNPPLTSKDNGAPGPVQKMQQALLDVGEVLPNFGADGNWGNETIKAVASFQSKNGIQPGGFEAGRKTLLALDAHLQQQPPKPPPPPPPPGQVVTVTAQCGQDKQAGTVVVTGSGFPPGEVDLAVDGVAGNAALAGDDKTFTGSVSANLKDGSHVVKATSGAVQGFAQFTTPCGGQVPPTPVPPTVNSELETVLDRIEVAYQLMITRERDGVQAVIRDLTPLDIADPSLAITVLRGLLQGTLTFLYGAGEGLLRVTINKANHDPQLVSEDAFTLDNANDKVFDAMWQACTGFISELLAGGSKKAAEERSNMLADFADGELSLVTKAGFTAFDKFERDGKNDLRSPARGKLPPPPVLSGEAGTGGIPPSVTGDPRVDRARVMLNSVNTAAANAFKQHYQAALDRWDIELAKGSKGLKLKTGSFGGGEEQIGTEPVIDPSTGQPLRDPDTGEVITKPKMAAKQSLDLSPLQQNPVTGAPPSVPPGVIDMLIFSGLPSGKVQVGPSSVDGLSPRTRQKVSELPVAQLGIPLVAQGTFRLPGPPLDDDFLLKAPVVVGVNEVGHVFDLTTNSSGVEWLDDKGNGNHSAGVQKVADELKASKMGTIDKK